MKNQHELMQGIPLPNVDWYMDEETERIVLKRPKYFSEIAKKLLSPFNKSEYFSVKLDDIGTVVWENCDGKNTVKEIGEILGQHFGPDIEPIYDRLFKFMMQLYKAKMITFIKQDAPS